MSVNPDLLFSLVLFVPSDQSSGGRGLMIFMFQAAAFIAIIYFLMIRPKVQQEKKHKERLAAIKRGDEILTVGGLVAEVVHIKDDRITIRSGESKLVIRRDRIAEVLSAAESKESKTQ